MPVPLIAYETLCALYGEALTKMFYTPISAQRGPGGYVKPSEVK